VNGRYKDNKRISGTKVTVKNANLGEYEMKYTAPVTSASLYSNMYYGEQSTTGNVVLRTIGTSLNTTVTNIDLSKTQSTVECFGGGTAVAGDRITCRVVAVDTSGKTITVPSYATALIGHVTSDSGEKQIASIYYNLNEFEVSFTLRKQGKATLIVNYVTSNGYKALNTGEVITITPGSIDASKSRINCFAGANVFTDSVCYFTMVDAYGNPTGTNDDKGGFSVIASSTGKQSIEVSGNAEYNSLIGNRYKMKIPIQISGEWTIQGQYLDTSLPSTVTIRILSGPLSPSTSIFV
jgi:hypothetical protein